MKALRLPLCAVVAWYFAACGTIMHPERRGQRGGDLDVGVAVLDGIGLLFFIIPGVIAFAVDFSNGTIYYPGGHHHHSSFQRFDPSEGLAGVERRLESALGRSVDLRAPGVRVARAGSKAELAALLSRAE